MPEAKSGFEDMLGELLAAGQKRRTVRRDIDLGDVDAILVGAQAMQATNPDAAERLTEVVLTAFAHGDDLALSLVEC